MLTIPAWKTITVNYLDLFKDCSGLKLSQTKSEAMKKHAFASNLVWTPHMLPFSKHLQTVLLVRKFKRNDNGHDWLHFSLHAERI